MARSLSVILPTYNEAGHIVGLVEEICRVTAEEARLEIEIILVDDNSPDGTAKIVRDYFRDDSRIKIYVRTEERGLASALRFGLEKATGENLVFMDTDFNHEPRVIPLLVKELQGSDIAVGSRFVPGGGMKGTQFRCWGSRLFNLFIKFILQIRTNDNLCGFFAASRKVVEDLNPEQIFSGYGDYFIRFLYEAARRGLSIIEIPVVYQERPSGKSKTNFSLYLYRYILTVFRVRFGK